MDRVLIVSKNLCNQGGVVDFVATAMEYFTNDRFEICHFSIGKKTGEKFNILRNNVLSDSMRLCLKSWRENWGCIHMNPSFVWKSLIRDLAIIYAITLKKK